MVSEEVARVVGPALQTICQILNERDRRLVMGTFALTIGRGGNAFVSSVTGASKNTVTAGSKEIFNYPASQVLKDYKRSDAQSSLVDDEQQKETNLSDGESKTGNFDDALLYSTSKYIGGENTEDNNDNGNESEEESLDKTVTLHREPGYKEDVENLRVTSSHDVP